MVMNDQLRPEAPKTASLLHVQLVKDCTEKNPADRPDFSKICEKLGV